MAHRHTLAGFGLASVLTLGLAAVAQAQPSSTGGGGQMAYPDSLKSGQVQVPSSTTRDTGNMQYPASSGGITTTAAPRSANTGNMQYPAGNSLGSSKKTAAAKGKAMSASSSSAAPSGAGATPQGMAAARALANAPGAAAVPYVDFGAPSASSAAKPMHHAAKPMKKPSA